MTTNQNQNRMSPRDQFAAAALQGMLANPGYHLFQADEESADDITNHAFRIADAMLAVRERKEGA